MGLVAGALGAIGSSLLIRSIVIFIFFVAPLISAGVLRLIPWVTRKRGPLMQAAMAAALIAGAGLAYFFVGGNVLGVLVFLVLAIAAVYNGLK